MHPQFLSHRSPCDQCVCSDHGKCLPDHFNTMNRRPCWRGRLRLCPHRWPEPPGLLQIAVGLLTWPGRDWYWCGAVARRSQRFFGV